MWSRIWLLLLRNWRRHIMLLHSWWRRSHIGWRSVWIVLMWKRSIVVLLRHRSLGVVVGTIGLHVVLIHLRRILLMLLMLVLMLLVLVMRSPPAHIRWHALPCRQMTAVHHAGLGGRCFSQLDRVQVEL